MNGSARVECCESNLYAFVMSGEIRISYLCASVVAKKDIANAKVRFLPDDLKLVNFPQLFSA